MKETKDLCIKIKDASKKDRKKAIRILKDNGFRWWNSDRFKDGNFFEISVDMQAKDFFYYTEDDVNRDETVFQLPKDFDKLKSYFEEGVEEYKTGNWYQYDSDFYCLVIKDLKDESYQCCYFRKRDDGNGYYFEENQICDLFGCVDADMAKVKELLIKEAKRRGLVSGVNAKSPLGKTIVTLSHNCEYEIEQNIYFTASSGSFKSLVVFDFKTGKWAEIIKPSYEDLEKENEELKNKLQKFRDILE